MDDRKRSAAESDGNGAEFKKARVAKNDDDAGSTALLSSLPDGVRFRIWTYCDVDDLVSVESTCAKFRTDVAHDSLDQSRRATARCRGSNFAKILGRLCTANFNRFLFSRNRSRKFKHLKVENHHLAGKTTTPQTKKLIRNVKLPFRTLDLSFPTSSLSGPKKDRQVQASVPKLLSKIMPHLEEVDLSCMRTRQSALADFARNCSQLRTVRWNHCDYSCAFATGQDLYQCRNLREVCFDYFKFYVPTSEQEKLIFYEMSAVTFFPLCLCSDILERISLVDAKYYNFDEGRVGVPFTQTGLIKLVRGAPKLRWLRSDLSPDNVDMLKAEFPHITFCSK